MRSPRESVSQWWGPGESPVAFQINCGGLEGGGAASHETEKAARAVGGQQESKESMTCVLTEW